MNKLFLYITLSTFEVKFKPIQTGVKGLSETSKIDPEKAKEIRERSIERNLIIQEIKSKGPSTIDELAKTTGMEHSKLLNHLIAMKQFEKVSIVGERDNQLLYGIK